jgi:hypothetical protein
LEKSINFDWLTEMKQREEDQQLKGSLSGVVFDWLTA